MPVFNGERWLSEAIESVLRQSWGRLELIIVDDGSTDESVRIAEHFASRSVVVLRQANQGASVARNAGLALAQGDFIQYLDADDLLDPRKIELQIGALSDAPGQVATCAWARLYDGIGGAQFEPSVLWRNFAPVDFLVAAYASMHFMPNHAWLTPRAISDRAGTWPPMRARNDDAEYFAKVVLQSSGVRFVPEARAYYRSGHSGLSAASDREALEGYLWTLDQIADRLLAAEDSTRTRSALAASIDHFVSSVEVAAPDLARSAEQRVHRLVGRRFVMPNDGLSMRVLSRLLGRSGARALRRALRRRVR